jgi:hypothetical protein
MKMKRTSTYVRVDTLHLTAEVITLDSTLDRESIQRSNAAGCLRWHYVPAKDLVATLASLKDGFGYEVMETKTFAEFFGKSFEPAANQHGTRDGRPLFEVI